MDLRRELVFDIGAIVALNVVLAFGVIGLFVRMGPAIEKILEENVASVVAAEEILAVFAAAGDAPLGPAQETQVRGALERATANVTEEAEGPVLAAMSRDLPVAVRERGDARRRVVDGAGRLSAINHAAMRAVDEDAQRLGAAGAWAAVLVGFLSLLLSLFVLARLRRRVLLPVLEIHDVLGEASFVGKRRCRPRESALEIGRIADSVNGILDDRAARWLGGSRGAEGVVPESSERSLHAALVALLGEEGRPALVVDEDGRILRANASALAALAGSDGERLREALRPATVESQQPGAAGTDVQAGGGVEPAHAPRAPWKVTALAGDVGWICRLDGPS